jgi:hypothetical protein
VRLNHGLVVVGILGLGAAALPLTASSNAAREATHSAATAGVHDVTCHSGQILTGFFGNVTVPKGNYCELLQAVVEGNVFANGALQLGIDHSVITGNVTANRVTDNGWICGSQIAGNVTIDHAVANPETATSPGTWVIGDPSLFGGVSYCGNTGFDQVPGNVIEGTLNFVGDASGGAISDNDIEGALTCTGNAAPLAGTGNQVDGLNAGQCATFAGGTDNDTLAPGDND